MKENEILKDHHKAALEAASALLKWARKLKAWEQQMAAGQNIDDDEFMEAFAAAYAIAMEVVEYPDIDKLRDFVARG